MVAAPESIEEDKDEVEWYPSDSDEDIDGFGGDNPAQVVLFDETQVRIEALEDK